MKLIAAVKTLLTGLFLFISLTAAAGVLAFGVADAAVPGQPILMEFFYRDGCPHCQAEEQFLPGLQSRHPNLSIKRYEVADAGNLELYKRSGARAGIPEQQLSLGLVPLTIVGGKPFIGYDNDSAMGADIEKYIAFLEGNGGYSDNKRAGADIFGFHLSLDSGGSLALMAMIFGLADGINPCMFSVLLILLASLLSSADPKRAVKLGTVFGLFVFIIYFGLMAGIYGGLTVFGANMAAAIQPVKTALGAVFVAVGLWMAKDFFFLKPGQKVSFSIPQAAHPLIKKLVSKSSFGGVAVLALFSSLVELPCTFALPLGYVTILSERAVFPYFYLVLYNLFFVLPLFVIVWAVGTGFSRVDKMETWRERSKKVMRLVSGLLLVFLGIAFLAKIF